MSLYGVFTVFLLVNIFLLTTLCPVFSVTSTRLALLMGLHVTAFVLQKLFTLENACLPSPTIRYGRYE